MFFFSRRGITLIEVLVAVIVFGIGVITILSMVSKNISVADRLQIRTKATFLAKQGIEIVYNKRDSNLERGVNWNCVEMDATYNCNDFWDVGDFYKMSLSLTGYYDITPTTQNFGDNVLYYHTGIVEDAVNSPILSGFRYDHNGNDTEKTFFSRYMHFSGAYLQGDGGIADEDELLKVNSVVSYKKGGMTGEIVLESLIGDR